MYPREKYDLQRNANTKIVIRVNTCHPMNIAYFAFLLKE
jgi:hypothetical protein